VLPALTHLHVPGEGASYTRRPEWTRSLESLWGILAKWQFVNRLPYWSIANCVSALSRANLYQGVDLRVLESFDLQALALCSGVGHSALCGGACVARSVCPELAFTSAHLRWCAACMNEGFHATLFQFVAINRCPIHGDRLIDTCPSCHCTIPYRLDTAFVANPLACPNCCAPLVGDPTVFLQAYSSANKSGNIWGWQRLLAKYAHWYAIVPRPRHPIAAHPTTGAQARVARPKIRLAFVGALQDVLLLAPSMPSIAQLRAGIDAPASARTVEPKSRWAPPFARQFWPHFHGAGFVDMCRRFSRFDAQHREQDDSKDQRTTDWWRRSWQGATARACSANTDFDDPPFGVAEWLAFRSQPALWTSATSNHRALVQHFEQDLESTWDAWSLLLKQMPGATQRGLHPRLIPPRGCWLNEPTFLPSSTALGECIPRISELTAHHS
jgi:hypothetical protein